MSSDPLTSGELVILESISRERPDRVVRLAGYVQLSGGATEALELLLFRGFSSCITHPTAFDPDQSVLPDGACIEQATLLLGPLNPDAEQPLLGPVPVNQLLDPEAWI